MSTDGRTDMTKLTVAFRTFAKAPKTEKEFSSKAPCTEIVGNDRSSLSNVLGFLTSTRLALSIRTVFLVHLEIFV